MFACRGQLWEDCSRLPLFNRLYLENNMSTMNKLALPAALLFAALTLSACATKPKEEAAEPAAAPVAEQPAAVAEPAPAPAPEAVAEAAPAPAASTQEEAPKPVVKKKKRKVVKAAPKPVEPAPVAEPAPAPAPTPAPVAEPVAAPAPAMVEAPIAPVEEQGFLAKYWAWLLGIIVAAIAIIFMMRKKD